MSATQADAEPPEPDDSPNGRSGCCYEETYPRMHALCPGVYDYRATANASPERRRCSCRCHEVGVEVLGMPTLRSLIEDLARGGVVRGGRRLHGNWKGSQFPRSLKASSWPLS